jgi:hypothetical protein
MFFDLRLPIRPADRDRRKRQALFERLEPRLTLDAAEPVLGAFNMLVEVTVQDTILSDGQAAAVTLGNAVIGRGRPSKTVAVRNIGTEVLQLGKPYASSPYFLAGTHDGSFGTVRWRSQLPPGESTEITVYLRTSEIGTFSTTISIPMANTGDGIFNFPVTGSVTPIPANQVNILPTFYLSFAESGTVLNSDGTSTAFEPQDILRLFGAGSGHHTFTKVFDGSDIGWDDPNENIDALRVSCIETNVACSFLISTSGNATLPGSGLTITGADIARLSPKGGGTIAFRASDHGINNPVAGNIDALDYYAADRDSMLLSFMGDVSLPGVGEIHDEDIVLFKNDRWEKYLDGEAAGFGGPGWDEQIPAGGPWSFFSGDFDGNGQDDVAGYDAGTGALWVFKSNGQGFSGSIWASGFPQHDNWQFFVGDFNGDGMDDLVGYRPFESTFWVNVSSGSAFQGEAWSRGLDPTTGWAFWVGDFNGDGLDDIASYHPEGGRIWVNASTGHSFWPTQWQQGISPTDNWTFLVGDFNGDGSDDIAGYHPSDGTIWVNLSTGSSFLSSKWHPGVRPAQDWDFHVGDFDNDGLDDLVGYHPIDGSWWVCRSAGGRFHPALWLSGVSPREGWTHMVGEYTGDHSLDVASYHPSDGTVWVFASTQKTSFRSSKWASTLAPAPGWQFVTGDFNGDHRDDLTSIHLESARLQGMLSVGDAFSLPVSGAGAIAHNRIVPDGLMHIVPEGHFEFESGASGPADIVGLGVASPVSVSYSALLLDGQTGGTVPYTIDALAIDEGGSQQIPPLTIAGDLDQDSRVHFRDIRLLRDAIKAQDVQPSFDLNEDSLVNPSDWSFLIQNILGSLFGDANLDQRVDRTDAAIVASQYGKLSGATWEEGDTDANEAVDLGDVDTVQKGLATSPSPAPAPVRTFIAKSTLAIHSVVRGSRQLSARRNVSRPLGVALYGDAVDGVLLTLSANRLTSPRFRRISLSD